MLNMIGFVLTISGAWTIFFGIIYLEFFGDWIYRWLGLLNSDGDLEKYIWGTKESTFKWPLDRIEGFTFMLAVCLIIGWVHMGIGLNIGMVNGRREGNFKHVMEKGGLFLVLTGVLMIVAKFGLGWWPAWLAAVGALLAIGGIVLGGIGAGTGGAIEAIVGAGNLFSYARLIAIGLASVIMANVANRLAMEQAKSGWVGIIVGVIVFILLQALNLVIGVFSPSIHALRLHLVESFGKFFEPAKIKYEPFRKTGGEE
jgi:V/A-type H+-transporting ATPase subunit I